MKETARQRAMNYWQWRQWRGIQRWLRTPPKTTSYLNGEENSPAIDARIDAVLGEASAGGTERIMEDRPLPLWRCKLCGMETRITISWACPKNDDTQCEFEKAKGPAL
jgi:hypothetical protein